MTSAANSDVIIVLSTGQAFSIGIDQHSITSFSLRSMHGRAVSVFQMLRLRSIYFEDFSVFFLQVDISLLIDFDDFCPISIVESFFRIITSHPNNFSRGNFFFQELENTYFIVFVRIPFYLRARTIR